MFKAIFENVLSGKVRTRKFETMEELKAYFDKRCNEVLARIVTI